jgi:hypothetical protein
MNGLPCDNCGTICNYWCQKCKIYYCSRTCQVSHYPAHKLICDTTIAKRFRKLLKSNLCNSGITWVKSTHDKYLRMCVGCGLSMKESLLFCYQWIPTKTSGNVKCYYCMDCHSQNRMIHPVSLMTLRETWIVFLLCWRKLNMTKDLLPIILSHLFLGWMKDADIWILNLPNVSDYYCGNYINGWRYEYQNNK